MEIRELQREASDAERLAERTRAVLDLANQVGTLRVENDQLRKQVADRDEELATLRKPKEEVADVLV